MRLFEKVANYASIFFLSVAVLLVTFNVTARYVFNSGVPWCEEAIRYSVVFATFFGLSLVISKNECMKIDVLLQITTGKVKWFINLLGVLFEFVVVWSLVYFSYLLVVETYETGQITPSTDYPMWIPYAVVFLGVLCCAISSVRALFAATRKGGEK